MKLKKEVTRLEREASAARGEAKAAEARAVELQKLVDEQTEYVPVTYLLTEPLEYCRRIFDAA